MRQLTPVDVEERIVRLSDELDEQVALYADLAEARAEAEAEYKHRQARAMIDQPNKQTVSMREAIAHLRASDQFRAFRVAEAREKATQAKMTAIRSQLDALRTIAANVRMLTR